jgi:aminopeptidase
MDTAEFFDRYAAVVASVGLNIQPNQEVFVSAALEAADFVPHFVRAAYRRKARYVQVDYHQQAVTRARLEEAPAETLDYLRAPMIDERVRIARSGGAALSILGADPTGLAGIDPARRAPVLKASAEARREISELTMSDFYPWCVISIPNPVWAKAVFPDLPEQQALDRLVEAVGHACRLDTDDPVAAWTAHSARLMKLAGWLTREAFDRFHYEGPGTDLVVGMPANQRWIGTEGTSAQGITFIANLPTDEVFCAPDWRRVEGTVRSTRPLIQSSTSLGIVEFEVRDGRIVGAHAEHEQEVLEQALELDEHARYFGEIALVDQAAPIAELGITFFDGLYDENAGCHLAFGNAYANCVHGGDELTEEERREAGLNTSRQHSDVTVGSSELSITAVRADGSTFPLMREGRWTSELSHAVGWIG